MGRDTTFGKIIEAVEHAEKSRAPIQKTADRLAGYLVYFALGAAVLTFLITHNVRSTISVVIVAGACGIAAGTPLAILGAIGRAAHHGAIIKGGLYLEAMAKVDTVLLDKTGTLTFGTPQIRDVVSANGFTEREILAAASVAERKSEHPLSKAIIARAADLAIPVVDPEEFAYTPGKGVIAHYQGEEIIVGSRTLLMERGVKRVLPVNGHGVGGISEVYVAKGGRVLGTIRIADVLRPEAKSAVAAMRGMGLTTILLSGDAQEVTTLVGRDLGVDEAVGELLPDQKAQWVTDLRAKNRTVVMLGDGINDAPALVLANVGVAMGSGTDVARESADVILIGSDLSKFVEALRIARRCRGVIMQNFVGTLVSGQHRSGNGGFWFSESVTGSLHSRHLRAGFYSQFHEIVAARFENGVMSVESYFGAGASGYVTMYLAYVIHDRKWRVLVVLLALIVIALCVAAFAFLSEKSREPFGIDQLYGWLD